MSGEEPPIVSFGEIARLDYRPGDVFVFTTARHLSWEERLRIQRAWEVFLSPNHARLLIVHGGDTLAVMPAEAAPT